ncbi:hypothetical protein DERP_013220 [Dermatophagoides pteronyssinus]|uniref:Uncharacterized protein n=1 Tax=Dermatophagoides pteronyssinus TaxID=6956 RepID=A0ABQ8IRF8_DERPT|nr:hypothetical protein DERP_013220 [Dermatophagoides pteronyssinus]
MIITIINVYLYNTFSHFHPYYEDGIRMHEPMQQYCPLFLESLIVAFGGRATIILHFVTILYAFFNEMASIFADKMKKRHPSTGTVTIPTKGF